MEDATSSKLPSMTPKIESSYPKKRLKRTKQANKPSTKGKEKELDPDYVEWNWQKLTDSSLSDVPPIFSTNGNYLFTLVGPSIKISSTTTGELLSTLTAPNISESPASDLTCMALNPDNAFQLIVGSRSGHISIWDYIEAILLRTIELSQPIHRLVSHPTLHDAVFVSVSKSRKGKQSDDSYAVLRVSLVPVSPAPDKSFPSPSEIVAVGKSKLPTGLALSHNGAWLVATAGHKIYVANTSSLEKGFVKYVSPEKLTCLSFHPLEEYFATGDTKGVVRLWYCLNEQIETQMKAVGVEKKTQTSALHWHSHAVSAVSFSSDGAHLFSGGEEAVLVIWQLQTGRKEFIPRVGAPIKTISTTQLEDGEEVLLGLADATNLFVKTSTLKVVRSFSNVKIERSEVYRGNSRSSLEPPLAYHHLTSTLVFPSSHPSSLQIFSLLSRKVIAELEVAPTNRVSRRDEKPLEPPYVERVAISDCGAWMVTIDTRVGDAAFRAEAFMKFWQWDQRTTSWSLNTRIDRPHGLQKILALEFSPGGLGEPLQLVSTGDDNLVRTWRVRSSKEKAGPVQVFWVARASLNLRSETPVHASWSRDGSILGVVYSSNIVLYDSQSCSIKATLSSSASVMPLALHFVGQRYIVAHGDKWVEFWDILSRSILWKRRILSPIHRVLPHLHEDSFVVMHEAKDGTMTHITRFGSTSHDPTSYHSLPFGLRNVITPASPVLSSEFSLTAITNNWSVAVFGDIVQTQPSDGINRRNISAHSLPSSRSLFRDIFGQSDVSNISGPSQLSRSELSSTHLSLSDVFHGPTYLMPPLETFFEPLVLGSIHKAPVQTLSAKAAVESEEEEVTNVSDISAGPLTKNIPTVSEVEFTNCVELFAPHTIKVTPSQPQAQTNGRTISKVNGARASPKVNGNLKAPKPSPALPQQLLSPSPSPEPGQATGKKRKQVP